MGGGATQKEVKITYETLYGITRREKNRDEMQELPEDFFIDVVVYLKQKEHIVEDARKRFDLFSTSEREKTEIQLKNIKKLLKELYDKRESKILTMALNKSRTKTNMIDLSSLLPEERILFDALVFALNNGREGIVFNVLQGKHPNMVRTAPRPPQVLEKTMGDEDRTTVPDSIEGQEQFSDPEVFPKPPEISTKDIKFIDDVEKFVGSELEEYGPFNKDETKTLPQEIAEVLIAAGKAVAQE